MSMSCGAVAASAARVGAAGAAAGLAAGTAEGLGVTSWVGLLQAATPAKTRNVKVAGFTASLYSQMGRNTTCRPDSDRRRARSAYAEQPPSTKEAVARLLAKHGLAPEPPPPARPTPARSTLVTSDGRGGTLLRNGKCRDARLAESGGRRSTVGLDEDKVRKYIQEQEEEEKRQELVKFVFESLASSSKAKQGKAAMD